MAEGYKDWSAGDILTAADLEDYTVKQSVMVFADASARTTALTSVLREGMVSYLKDTDSTEVYDGSAWAAVGPGKILQMVRATDTTSRTTTSTSFVDANISVTITPTSASSTILVVWTYRPFTSAANESVICQITDSSNVALSGAEALHTGISSLNLITTPVTAIGYSAPATTSATTYKGRFRSENGGTQGIQNHEQTGQLIALEVSA
ncbi:MAG: hypothetical protein ACO3O3_06950 [Ilumatobacteraceae bacterium]